MCWPAIPTELACLALSSSQRPCFLQKSRGHAVCVCSALHQTLAVHTLLPALPGRTAALRSVRRFCWLRDIAAHTRVICCKRASARHCSALSKGVITEQAALPRRHDPAHVHYAHHGLFGNKCGPALPCCSGTARTLVCRCSGACAVLTCGAESGGREAAHLMFGRQCCH